MTTNTVSCRFEVSIKAVATEMAAMGSNLDNGVPSKISETNLAPGGIGDQATITTGTTQRGDCAT
eukprot:CAMPEP_0178723776 /NCGR_PEP_ID=MMETSP0699-20121125/25740_1 /TAXON_ID=265572 /ORGANISM="Extubocellulus spinifer, Strain CCMP396" /LENGTH=64 /DNA_ID=CAMNT_0020374905 /DNA_START=2055 /DNA_END=2245 /DNA_ORIENTATION=-